MAHSNGKKAARDGNRKDRVCAEHLKKYNEALQLMIQSEGLMPIITLKLSTMMRKKRSLKSWKMTVMTMEMIVITMKMRMMKRNLQNWMNQIYFS